MTRTTRMLMLAADEAVVDSGIDFQQYEGFRTAVILGVISTSYNDIEKEISTSGTIVRSMVNAPSAWVSMKYGIEGPAFSVATACASSGYAISIACNMIRSGTIDAAIVGGADSHLDPENIEGFNKIFTLSVRNDSPQSASRPFSKNRDGFVIGEGAGVMVIESEETAQKRGARIYAEIAGSAITSEANDITAPIGDGSGMAKTMTNALKDAGISRDEVDYINAHGTSTYLNDKCETLAIKKVFQDRCYDIAVSSCKSMIGHTVAAAGAIEGIITVKSICEEMLTPTINYDEPDEELDLDYVPNVAREKKINVALSNSFGFGGHNATLVFRKYIE
jgi:3-oxoacyl-[acyl-carrier-protein] synthase II